MFLILLASCTLNAEQEASLNRAINRHLGAMNEGRMLQFISEIHPNAVKFHKRKGNEHFEDHFRLVDSTEVFDPNYYQDPLIQESAKEGNTIHIRYEVLCISFQDFSEESLKYEIFAVSEDNGKTWSFLHKGDYYNDDILAPKQRLIQGK